MSLRFRKLAMAYAFMLLPLVFLGVFVYYPMISGVVLSLYSYDIISKPVYVGLQNYAAAIGDPEVWSSMFNSVKYLLVVPFIQLVALLLAMLVNQKLRGVKFFRALYFFPVITPIIVVALIWKWVFQSDGILNYFLAAMGLVSAPVPFLSSPSLALFSVMFVTFWTGIGYYMMIYLAGLQGLPHELIEAAQIDGAPPLAVFVRVIIPLMKPYLLYCFIMSTIAALSVFTEVYAITNGGPLGSSQTMGLLIYNTAFEDLKFGYASTQAVLISVVILIVTGINLIVSRRGGLEGYTS